MRSFRNHTRFIALPMAAMVALLSTPVGTVQAAMVSTEQLYDHAYPAQTNADESTRDRVMNFLKRQDVRDEMRRLGVDPDEAMARANALSDNEIQLLAGKLDQLPAGGSAVGAIIGAAVFVFVVLLVTDLLCFTKVFPFTKCINK